jgi:AcrR family transcriptional regulator
MRMTAEQRRVQLLVVARDVFADGGFHATSMDDVANAAGVTKPVLYQHFPSKRSLYVELLQQVGRELLAELGAATATAGSGREKTEQGFSVYFRYVFRNPNAFRVLFGASVRNDAEFASVAEDVVEAAAAVVSDLIDVPASPAHRSALAHALVGMAESLGRRALSDSSAESDPEVLAAWIAELAWFGLRGVRAEIDALAARKA